MPSDLGPPAAVRPSPRAACRRGQSAVPALTLVVAALVAGCSGSAPSDPLSARGRQVYLAQCTACHASDPSQPGPVGPPVRGSSRALLEARVVRGAYPPGYTPKRRTTIMPPQPQAAGDIDALAAYLK